MSITINNLQISGTSTNPNYIQGNWIKNDSVTSMNFSYLGVKNSTVAGGLPGGWYALETDGNVDYGNNTGWVFVVSGTESDASFIVFFDVNSLL